MIVRKRALFLANDTEAATQAFLVQDKEYSRKIDKRDALLYNTDRLAEFDTHNERWFAFLQRITELSKSCKFEFTLIAYYAMYYLLIGAPDGREDILLSYIKNSGLKRWVNAKRNSIENMWEGKKTFDVSVMETLFGECIDDINRLTVVMPDVLKYGRISFKPALVTSVWEKCNADSIVGNCTSCNVELQKNNRKVKKGGDSSKVWHVGHILALTENGSNKLSNLTVLCGRCNLSMGSESVEEYSEFFDV